MKIKKLCSKISWKINEINGEDSASFSCLFSIARTFFGLVLLSTCWTLLRSTATMKVQYLTNQNWKSIYSRLDPQMDLWNSIVCHMCEVQRTAVGDAICETVSNVHHVLCLHKVDEENANEQKWRHISSIFRSCRWVFNKSVLFCGLIHSFIQVESTRPSQQRSIRLVECDEQRHIQAYMVRLICPNTVVSFSVRADDIEE